MSAQRQGSQRIVLSKQKRQSIVRAQTATASLHIADARVSLPHLPSAVDALAAAETQLGKGYALYGCRCYEVCQKRDCSGLIFFAVNHITGSNLCGSSFSLAALGREYGTLISEEEAIWTPFALGIRCGFCSPNAIGSNGHVVSFKGDGQTTVEEGGHATGCYRGRATGRGFDVWMKYPGLDYSATGLTPTTTREQTMFVQSAHYNDKGNVTRKTDPPAGKDSTVSVSDDGLFIEARWDASIDNDQPADAHYPKVLRRWNAPAFPLPAGVTFVAVSYREPDAIDHRPGGVALLSNGDTRRLHLS